MRRKEAERTEARRLRVEEELSLRAIAARLGVGLGTVSVWVRDIPRTRLERIPLPPGARPFVGIRLPVWTSGELKRCGRCRLLTPVELFNRMGDGRQHWCRECFAEYFRLRGALHKQQSYAALAARRARARRFLIQHLSENPCVDCGEADVAVLELDHLRDKLRGVGVMVHSGEPLEVIRTEVAKCEVVCVNCHKRRTDARRPERAEASPHERRNRAFVTDALHRSGCCDCGARDVDVLEFDHLGPKRGGVGSLVGQGYSIATIAAEIAQCAVRCGNCHRRRTSERGGHYRSRLSKLGGPP